MSSGLLPVELYSFLVIELASQCWLFRLLRFPVSSSLPERFTVTVLCFFSRYVWFSVDNIVMKPTSVPI